MICTQCWWFNVTLHTNWWQLIQIVISLIFHSHAARQVMREWQLERHISAFYLIFIFSHFLVDEYSSGKYNSFSLLLWCCSCCCEFFITFKMPRFVFLHCFISCDARIFVQLLITFFALLFNFLHFSLYLVLVWPKGSNEEPAP